MRKCWSARDYAAGKGTPQSFEEAAKWYRLAAAQGEAHAQFLLGILYATGKGVPHDPEQSAKWYRQAAEQGVAGAQSRLGRNMKPAKASR